MKILLAGATGKMGVAITQAAAGVATIFSLARDAETLSQADALIDFTRPEHSLALAALCANEKTPMVCGTTGFSDEQFAALQSHAQHTAILWSANMSVGVNLLMKLVREAAAALDESYDIEISDIHHRHKVDAPSGTALLLGEAAAHGRGKKLSDVRVALRDGVTGARENGTIGFASQRAGSVIGDHTVMFAGNHDRIELSHKAQDRNIYAHGALKAAVWLKGKPARFYSMQDLLEK